jgi:hypothetical protein
VETSVSTISQNDIENATVESSSNVAEIETPREKKSLSEETADLNQK